MGASRGEELCLDMWDVVSRIPAGRVASYGQVAALAGHAGAARHAGRCLSRLPEGSGIPWHRVLNAQGRITAPPQRGGRDCVQRTLLEAEGVEFSATGRVNLRLFGWGS